MAKVEVKKATRRERPNLVGVVTSDKRRKSITVEYHYSVRHPKYGKYLRRRGRVHAHDEKNDARQGDRVEVAFCKRFSKSKCWRLVRIVERNPLAVEAAETEQG